MLVEHREEIAGAPLKLDQLGITHFSFTDRPVLGGDVLSREVDRLDVLSLL